VRLYQSAGDPAIRQFLARMIAAVLFVAWEEPLRRGLHAIAGATAGDWLRLRAELLFWIGRELVWWWLIAGLAAIVLTSLLRTPLIMESRTALGQLLRKQRRQMAGWPAHLPGDGSER
jgi:hypothetical protein